MKIVSLYGKKILLADKFIALGTQEPYITINLSSIIFTYESGLTDYFNITSNTSYTITTGSSWIGVNQIGGSGNLTVTVETLSENVDISNRTGTVTVQSLDLTITVIITITQNFQVQPLLYIMTEGGVFVGDLI